MASSIDIRVSLVNLQKFTLCPWLAPPSMRMLAPAQNTPSLPERSTTARTSGCSKRSRCTASYKLDVHAKIVGIQLQLIALEQPAGRIDVHDQVRHRPSNVIRQCR